MPDSTIDFCQTRRGEVIDYVRERYGADRVAQIITFGSFPRARRVAGRGPGWKCRSAVTSWPSWSAEPAKPVTLKEALAGEQKLREASSRTNGSRGCLRSRAL